MNYGNINCFQTGVAIPLSGLKSHQSLGIGEFADLLQLGKWAKSCGMHLIQLLPLNDTGLEPSPYSAQSAFALNPAYIRLQDIPEAEGYSSQIQHFALEHQNNTTVQYQKVYQFKFDLLQKAFASHFEIIEKNKTFVTWIKNNTWVKAYSVYVWLKQKNNLQFWMNWPEYSNIKATQIAKLFKDHFKEIGAFAWMQWIAEQQFTHVAQELDSIGIRIKGDIPILISEDSADVWYEREYFSLHLRAGAPPDMFCEDGQNWRFPTYNWDVLEQNNYSWWKSRLKQASKFYHAFRIDHVLGFFRIWQIPEKEYSGTLGAFVPSLFMSHQDLINQGLDANTIEFLKAPHWSYTDLIQDFGNFDWNPLIDYRPDGRVQISNRIQSENDILALKLPQDFEKVALKFYRERIFLSIYNDDRLSPYWYFEKTVLLQKLDTQLQNKIHQIVNVYNHKQEALWAENGYKLLKMMQSETNMLVCAEDLGVVPDCVGPTLQSLNILSLKIERWTRDWKKPNTPYLAPADYPFLSVCSPACHDTSNLREFWESGEFDKTEYSQHIGRPEASHEEWLSTETARQILEHNLSTQSLIVIFPLQDWLSVYYNLRTAYPHDERINTPGTLSPSNWCWRMNIHLEDLCQYSEFNAHLNTLVQTRTQRSQLNWTQSTSAESLYKN